MKFQKAIQITFSMILILVTLLWASSIIYAAPGDIDPNFTPPNISSLPPFGSFHIFASVLQPDGKVVIGGQFNNVDGMNRISIARLNADGSHDMSFVSPFVSGSTSTSVQSLALQADGKILVGGTLITPGGLKTLVRVNSDGSLDSTFIVAQSSVFGIVLKIIVQPNGQILASGNFSGVTVLNPDGSLVQKVGTILHDTAAFVLQPDGKIVISGLASFGGVSTFRFIGTDIDPTFHGGMILPASGAGMEIQADGKIIIYGNGFMMVDGITRRGMIRLNTDGTVDTSFDAGDLGGFIAALKLQTDGKIIVAGYFIPPGSPLSYGFARLNSDGTLDSTFQVAPPDRNINDIVRSIIIQSDGRIILGGDFTVFGNFTNFSDSANLISTSGIARVFGSSPTAASVNVGGRVTTFTGRGISRVRVTLTDAAGATRYALTNPFGFYRFADVPAGATSVFSVSHKKYFFSQSTQVRSIMEETSDVNFIADD